MLLEDHQKYTQHGGCFAETALSHVTDSFLIASHTERRRRMWGIFSEQKSKAILSCTQCIGMQRCTSISSSLGIVKGKLRLLFIAQHFERLAVCLVTH